MSYITYNNQRAQRALPWGNLTTASHPGFLLGMGAFGATDFNASLIWADCLKGAPPTKDNAASKRCGQAVQMALNELGYGPLTVDGELGTQSIAAIKKFSLDNGFGSQNWPTQAMLIKMGQLLAAGETPGPSTPIVHHVVDGQVIPGAAPGSGISIAGAKMSTGTMVAIGAIGAVAIAAIAIMAKKKKKGPQPVSSSTMVKV